MGSVVNVTLGGSENLEADQIVDCMSLVKVYRIVTRICHDLLEYETS